MSVAASTQTDPYETLTIGMLELTLLEQLQSKWFRTFPTLSPLTQLRIDLGLATKEAERASYEREFRPAFGSMDTQLKKAEEIFHDVETEWRTRENKKDPEAPKVVEVEEVSDQCSCRIFC